MIRQAISTDFNDIQAIYTSARNFMMEHGNPTQWGSAYPPQETILQDIKQGILFVLEDEEGLYGVFALIAGEEAYLLNAWNTRKPVIITFVSIPMSKI